MHRILSLIRVCVFHRFYFSDMPDVIGLCRLRDPQGCRDAETEASRFTQRTTNVSRGGLRLRN